MRRFLAEPNFRVHYFGGLGDGEQHMHAKLMVIDGYFSTVGSFNWDRLSSRRNLEVPCARDSDGTDSSGNFQALDPSFPKVPRPQEREQLPRQQVVFAVFDRDFAARLTALQQQKVKLSRRASLSDWFFDWSPSAGT